MKSKFMTPQQMVRSSVYFPAPCPRHRTTPNRGERGVVLTWLVVVLPVLLLLAYFVLNTVQVPLIKARVQSASDAAAHGATLILDPNDPDSWERSIVVAKSILMAHEAELGGFGNALEGDGPVYEDLEGRATITIERGRYIPAGLSGDSFQSLEDDSLEDNGLLPLAPIKKSLANAVNVRLELSAGSGIGSVFAPTWGDGGFSLSGVTIASESTVTFGKTEEFVPPFAIPLCSLLDGATSFDPNTICQSDRLFTTLEWEEKFSGAVPDFLYDVWSDTEVQTNKCHYDSPSYPEADNNYGVLGFPGGSDSFDASNLLDALDNEDDHPGLTSAMVGQRFIPLSHVVGAADIPTEIADDIGSRIWDLITNTAGSSDSSVWPSFSDGLNEMVGNVPAKIKPNWLPYPQGSQDAPDNSGWDQRCGQAFRPQDQNICGSRRFSWKCDSSNPGSVCETPALGPTQDTAWKVKVPLIAKIVEGRISECSANEGPLDTEDEYRIIGFVSMIVYDTDIGLARPTNDVLNVTMTQGLQGAVNCGGGGGTFPLSLPPLDLDPDIVPPQVGEAWGPSCNTSTLMYLDAITTRPPCNVVRARIDCNTAFEATKQAADGTFSLRLVR